MRDGVRHGRGGNGSFQPDHGGDVVADAVLSVVRVGGDVFAGVVGNDGDNDAAFGGADVVECPRRNFWKIRDGCCICCGGIFLRVDVCRCDCLCIRYGVCAGSGSSDVAEATNAGASWNRTYRRWHRPIFIVENAALRRCRSKGGNDLLQAGVFGGWRYGLRQGMACGICCAAPMLALLVLGMMNLTVMILVTVVVTAEKLLPHPERTACVFGFTTVVWGIGVVAQALFLQGI